MAGRWFFWCRAVCCLLLFLGTAGWLIWDGMQQDFTPGQLADAFWAVVYLGLAWWLWLRVRRGRP